MPPVPSQFNKSAMNQDDSNPPPCHGSSSESRDIHRCPYCPKKYTTSTWLGNHIKIKHSAGAEENSRRVLVGSVAQRSQPVQESYYSALVKDLQNMSSRLKQVLPLIDDVVPLLQELGEASSRSHAIDRTRLRSLKRRAPLDLREGESMKRQGIPAYSPGNSMPHDSEWARNDEPETRNNSPITSFVEGQRFTYNEFGYLPSVAQHTSPRPIQRSCLPPLQGMAYYPTSPGSGFHRRQLQAIPSQVPKSRTPNRRESFWNIQGPAQPIADARPLHSLDMSYQELPQGQSTTQTLQYSSGSSPMALQHGLENELDNLFYQHSFSSPLIASATGEPTLPAQLLGGLEERDDPLFSI